jgi:glycosyltransferase involved in cell wall biosynthesis
MVVNGNDLLITIATRDRPTELYGLLNSLRKQTYQNFDILIIDDASGNPIQNYYFIPYTIQRLRNEGHNVILIRNDFSKGVSGVRQQCVEEGLKGKWTYQLRIDDDSIAENNYIEELFKVINAGYDIASGVVPPFAGQEFFRDAEQVKPIIGECKLNDKGFLILNEDDCGTLYTDNVILPSHHFRSCALFKREVFEAGVDYKSRLSKNGYREEQLISFKAIVKGFTIGCNTGAICWHLLTPSGGERDTMNLTGFNQQMMEETTKKLFDGHGDFISKYNEKLGIKPKQRTDLELLKSTNLVSNKKEVNLLEW